MVLPAKSSKASTYAGTIYAKYFLWRGMAIILSRHVMEYILYDYDGESVREAFNAEAHFSGFHSQQEDESLDLLEAAKNLLPDDSPVKQHLHVYNTIFDICSSKIYDGREVPLDCKELQKIRSVVNNEGGDRFLHTHEGVTTSSALTEAQRKDEMPNARLSDLSGAATCGRS